MSKAKDEIGVPIDMKQSGERMKRASCQIVDILDPFPMAEAFTVLAITIRAYERTYGVRFSGVVALTDIPGQA